LCRTNEKTHSSIRDKESFFKRYLDGEDFNREKLENIGYDFWQARNINHFINSGDLTSLSWK
jgi:hypothetical protein